MNIQIKPIEQTVIELTEEQFNRLTGALVPATPAQIAEQAREILPSKYEKGNSSEIMNKIQACRNFLNMVEIVDEIRTQIIETQAIDRARKEA